jgi:hypothetical protein
MDDGNETGEHLGHGGHRKWYDSAKVVWALILSISFLIAAWGGVVYVKATSAEIKNAEQDVYIRVLMDSDRETQRKLDVILNRLK